MGQEMPTEFEFLLVNLQDDQEAIPLEGAMSRLTNCLHRLQAQNLELERMVNELQSKLDFLTSKMAVLQSLLKSIQELVSLEELMKSKQKEGGCEEDNLKTEDKDT